MKQLFVAHTQYNLVLCSGIAGDKQKENQADLILFQDFALTKELKSRLEHHFNKCLFLDGMYPKKDLSYKDKDKKIYDDCKKIKTFVCDRYDDVFIVDDMCIPEMYVLKSTKKWNPNARLAWIEDGGIAYYSNDVISVGMGATPLRRMIRKIYFSLRYDLFGFYDLAVCMGGHKKLSHIYVTFPGHVREELKNKKQIPITQEQFKKGLKIMYAGEPVIMANDCIVIAVDKLDVYGDKLSIVNQEVQKIVEQALAAGKKVYCKYHPRETQKMEALQNAEELNSKIAMEYYLTNTTAKDMTIVGVMSTALQTAKKLGFEVISLAGSVGTSKNVLDFYQSIDIDIK